MVVPAARGLILAACTASAFLVFGQAPGAVSLRTREIEAAVSAETTRAFKRTRIVRRSFRTKAA